MNREWLLQRGELLRRIRQFFAARGFAEVTTPRVDPEIIPEVHIDPFEVPGLGYLQASPEMHLKRLLCAGSGPIYEIAPCFRRNEFGPLHRPQFTMIEWYRPGDNMQAGMQLLAEFVSITLPFNSPPPLGEATTNFPPPLGESTTNPPPPLGEGLGEGAGAQRTTYRQAFERVLDIDPHTAPLQQLQQLTGQPFSDRDEQLNLLLAKHIEPTLGRDRPELLSYFPASQAALATTTVDEHGIEVAERFELYYRGIELANGYHELTNGAELRRRLHRANDLRTADGRPALNVPEKLLAAMDHPGLPACAGVALGFDRLLMLAVGANSLDDLGI